MYKPLKDGIEKNIKSVVYLETEPPTHLNDLVHCFWELKTQTPLSENFNYHVMPDACVNILFDQLNPEITALTALQLEHKVLNLGKSFHFVGVQLLPGVWQGNPEEIQSDLVDKPYSGNLSLVNMNFELIKSHNFSIKQNMLIKFVEEFTENKLIATNPEIASILRNIINITSVSDMAITADLSARQLQRRIKKNMGMSPHDLLKILRLQMAFKKDYLDCYVDQSHFIHSFRKITGYTPTKYFKKFDV